MVYHWKVLWKFSISMYNFSLFLSRLTWSKLETSPQILHTGTKLGSLWFLVVHETPWYIIHSGHDEHGHVHEHGHEHEHGHDYDHNMNKT